MKTFDYKVKWKWTKQNDEEKLYHRPLRPSPRSTTSKKEIVFSRIWQEKALVKCRRKVTAKNIKSGQKFRKQSKGRNMTFQLIGFKQLRKKKKKIKS